MGSFVEDKIDKPWLLAGDFNTYKSLDGGSSNVMRKCAKFARWIDDCGLIALGFTGPKFTWWKEVGGKPYMKVRLDRALANAEWRHLYPEASVRHLPRVYSDHCLILIDTIPTSPFCFSAVSVSSCLVYTQRVFSPSPRCNRRRFCP